MARNYTAVPYEYLEEMEELTDEEFGRLVRGLLRYSRDGVEIPADGNLRFVVRRTMNREDRYREEFAKTEERLQKARRKRAAAHASDVSNDACTDACSDVNSSACIDVSSDACTDACIDADSGACIDASNPIPNPIPNPITDTEADTETEAESESERVYITRAREADQPAAPAAENRDAGLSGAFEAFWSVYPRRIGKDAAREEWMRIRPSYETQARMIDVVRQQAKSRQWTEGNGKFIPAPAKWLREGRWQDDTGDSTTTIQDVLDQMEDW